MSTYFSYLLFNCKAMSGLVTFLTLQATCCNFHNSCESQALCSGVWINSGRGNFREGSQVGDDRGCSGIPLLCCQPDPGWERTQIPEPAGGAGLSSPCWLIACRRSGHGLAGCSPAGHISQWFPAWEPRFTGGGPCADQELPIANLWPSALLHSLYAGQQFCTIGILYQYGIRWLRSTWLNWRGLTLAIQKVYHIRKGSHSKRHPAGKKKTEKIAVLEQERFFS